MKSACITACVWMKSDLHPPVHQVMDVKVSLVMLNNQ
jgi:hypothetical protein